MAWPSQVEYRQRFSSLKASAEVIVFPGLLDSRIFVDKQGQVLQQGWYGKVVLLYGWCLLDGGSSSSCSHQASGDVDWQASFQHAHPTKCRYKVDSCLFCLLWEVCSGWVFLCIDDLVLCFIIHPSIATNANNGRIEKKRAILKSLVSETLWGKLCHRCKSQHLY